MTDTESVASVVQQLSDLEIAMLLCLLSNKHGIIQAKKNLLDRLEEEIISSAKQIFDLSLATLHCTFETTLDDLISTICAQKPPHPQHLSPVDSSNGTYLPNLIIIKDLQKAEYRLQMRMLELMRTRRILTHETFEIAPKVFLVLLISDIKAGRHNSHVQDFVYLSHVHEDDEFYRSETHGVEAVPVPVISSHQIDVLRNLYEKVTMTVEISRYLNDVVIFLRTHRGVCQGTTPLATKYLVQMSKCLAVLHDLPYVTPPLINLAVRKIYRHRIVMVNPINERSLQYGSDAEAVASILEGLTPEMAIEQVLTTVECPF